MLYDSFDNSQGPNLGRLCLCTLQSLVTLNHLLLSSFLLLLQLRHSFIRRRHLPLKLLELNLQPFQR